LKALDRIKSITQQIKSNYRKNGAFLKAYPTPILDLILFHKFHFHFEPDEALANFRRLKNTFVDWNEVRISSVREIQEVVGFGPESLEIAIFIKDLLEHLNRRLHHLDLEFLASQTVSEIREFLKGIRGLDPSTVNLILRLRKDYPVLPLTPAMEASLDRIGVLRRGDSRDRKSRLLHELVDPQSALVFHHFFLDHSRRTCPPDETQVQCGRCTLKRFCSFFSKAYRRVQAPQRSSAARKKS
jgi:endonuclease III